MDAFKLIEKTLAGGELAVAEADFMVDAMASGAVPPERAAFFLGALRGRGECADELVGAANALRRRAVFIDGGTRALVDTCGTGGDGANTFNISTCAAFIAAGAGIAKHGNRAVSGKCGSADVLAACGFNLDVEPVAMEYAVQKIGIGFLFAQKLHPALGRLAPMRRAVGMRTLFNLAAPLANPAGARGHVLGVFSSGLVETYAHALRALGCRRAFVVHGEDGLDEISVCAPTRVCELRDGALKTYELQPERLVGERFETATLKGGDAAENAATMRGILEGRIRDARRAVAVVNAAAAIVCGGVAETLEEGCAAACQSLDSGAAREKLERLVEMSRV